MLDGQREIEEDSENLVNKSNQSDSPSSWCWPFSLYFKKHKKSSSFTSNETQTDKLEEKGSNYDQNVDLINEHEEISKLKSIINKLHSDKLELEMKIENGLNIENYEETLNQKILAQSFYINHLEQKFNELDAKYDNLSNNCISRQQYAQVEAELMECKNQYNSLCISYSQLYNYVQSIIPANNADSSSEIIPNN